MYMSKYISRPISIYVYIHIFIYFDLSIYLSIFVYISIQLYIYIAIALEGSPRRSQPSS